ncbi:RraA family protein, partial [Candidatus Poribacteria bacterium]
VLVIDAKGTTTRSCWGGLQTYAAKEREVSGIVIFGSVRDYQEIAEYDIPVYAAGVSPGGPLKGWGGFVNYPISCGGVPVLPGDVVVGDDDGIVVVPPDFLEEILPYCEERIKREEKWYKDVEQGISTIETVGLRENVEKLDIEFL